MKVPMIFSKVSGSTTPRSIVTALLTLLVLSGCASGPIDSLPDKSADNTPQTNIGAFDDAVSAGPQLSRFFDSASPGSTTALADSPMGKNVTVTVNDQYFSASGFNCLRIHVDHQTGAEPSNNIACRRSVKGSDNWVVERSVISMQQPEYTNTYQ